MGKSVKIMLVIMTLMFTGCSDIHIEHDSDTSWNNNCNEIKGQSTQGVGDLCGTFSIYKYRF
jgi:hypothetical protein